MGQVTVYHNPRCGTSNRVLALLEERGIKPAVIEYLKNPPSRSTLVDILTKMNCAPRAILRTNCDVYEELKLSDTSISDEKLIDLMLEHPILINRPIVITPKGANLCRPCELVLPLLADSQ
ncbi:MAG: arsenate reductase (glutaredoxin) [Enterovibrio sp.]